MYPERFLSWREHYYFQFDDTQENMKQQQKESPNLYPLSEFTSFVMTLKVSLPDLNPAPCFKIGPVFPFDQPNTSRHKRSRSLKKPSRLLALSRHYFSDFTLMIHGSSMLGNVIWPRRTELPQWLHPTPDGCTQSVYPRPQ